MGKLSMFQDEKHLPKPSVCFFATNRKATEGPADVIKTLLNKCHKFKSFIYQSVELAIYRGAEVLDITVVPRKNGHAICSGCHNPAPGYDQLNIRRFEFILIWGYRTFLLYHMRRVECRTLA